MVAALLITILLISILRKQGSLTICERHRQTKQKTYQSRTAISLSFRIKTLRHCCCSPLQKDNNNTTAYFVIQVKNRRDGSPNRELRRARKAGLPRECLETFDSIHYYYLLHHCLISTCFLLLSLSTHNSIPRFHAVGCAIQEPAQTWKKWSS